MNTRIDIDTELLEEARKLGHHRTNEETINEALTEYVRIRKQQKIIELFGTIQFDPDYDYKSERRSNH